MTTRFCPQCGVALPATADDWLCPRCLLAQAGALSPDSQGIDVPSQAPAQTSLAAPLILHYFGDYELIEEVARGGMGVVYKARQISLNRIVAVKMLAMGRFSGAAAVQRFRLEAEAAANLQHPHIVAIHEIGEHQGQQYFSMDYIEGGHLGVLTQHGALPARRAAQLMQTVADAVHHAHLRGVLHRDLKPSNILLDAEGQPHVTDFGLAKRFAADIRPHSVPDLVRPKVGQEKTGDGGLSDSGNRPKSPSNELTLSGQVLGTPSFMSPEQAGGRRRSIGVASDVYSLGAVLYFLVTGHPPFRGEVLEEVLRQVHEAEPVMPRLVNPAIPLDLEIVCLKCLSKEPARRYDSARALAEDLRRWLNGEPICARPIGPVEKIMRWCRRKPGLAAALAACALTLCLGISGISWQWRRAETQARQNSNIAEENRARLVRVNVANGLKLLDDGDSFGALPWFVEALALDSGDPAREEPHRLRIASALSASPRIVHSWFHDDAIEHAEFSPDGRAVLTASRDGTARVWSTITGRELLMLPHGGSVLHAKFNGDAMLIATASSSNTARIWDALTGRPISIVWHDGPVRRLAFSPDGQRLLTASADGTARVSDVFTGQSLTGSLPHRGAINACAFSPDGQKVATLSADQTARVWDARTGALLSTVLAMTPNVYDVAFSGDSRQLLAAGYAVARLSDVKTGLPVIPALVHAQAVTSASFSPDGQRLLTSSDDRTVCLWDTSSGRPVTSPIKLPQSVKHASFSPDGQWIVHAGQDGAARIWNARDSAPASPPLRHSRRLRRAWFSPDGRFVLTAGFDGMARLWAPSLGQPARVLPQGDRVRIAAFSPDGERIVTGPASGGARVWDTSSGAEVFRDQASRGAITDASFNSDGSNILIASLDGKVGSIIDARTGRERFSLPHTSGVVRALFTADNRRIVTLSSPDARVASDHRRVLAVRTNVLVQTWDATTGQALTSPLPLEKTSDPVALSPDGARVLTGFSGESIRIWDTATGEPTTSPIRPEQFGKFAQFSPDSRRVATADGDANSGRTIGAVEIWDTATGQRVGRTIHNKSGFVAAAFSSDARRLVTANSDGTARVWDVATGAPLTAPLVHRWDVLDAAFSADGCFVVTGSADTAVRVWDAGSGEPVTPTLLHGGYVIRTLFHPQARSVLAWAGQSVLSSTRAEDTVHVWSLPREGRAVSELRELAQLLAGGRVDTSGGFTPLEPEAARHLWNTVRAKSPENFGNSSEDVREAEEWETGERVLRSRAFWQRALRVHPDQAVVRETEEFIGRLSPVSTANTATTNAPTTTQPSQRLANSTWHSLRSVRLGIPPRPPEAGPAQIDLTRYYNSLLTDSWRWAAHECSMSEVPRGLVTLAGTVFDVRGVVQFCSRDKVDQNFAESVRGIVVDRPIRRLHFLHAGRLRVHKQMTVSIVTIKYADGARQDVPIRYGVETLDWWYHPKITASIPPPPPLVLAWEGENAEFTAGGARLHLFKFTWENSRRDLAVSSLDIVSQMSDFAPFVIAITAE